MRKLKSKKNILLVIITLIGTLIIVGSQLWNYTPQSTLPKEKYIVTRVIDGDTIEVLNQDTNQNLTIRYLGIDTPELNIIQKNLPAYKTCFSEQATEANKAIVMGKEVVLEFDQDKYDRFGRTLAYVYTLNEKGEQDQFVNLELILNGLARFYLDKQNTAHQDELTKATLKAQNVYQGLWGNCGEAKFGNKCVIKGNVDRLGKKYYHLPSDKYYSATIINLLKEDQWLCTIEEAEDKNFTHATQKD